MERHSVPEIVPPDDFGGLLEDINAFAEPDSPLSQYDVRKTLKAMRSVAQYSVGVHNTVNKSISSSSVSHLGLEPLSPPNLKKRILRRHKSNKSLNPQSR